MFTIDKDNTCYKRLLHKRIKIHLSCSLKLNLRGLKYPDNSPEYRKRKCEQTGDYKTEVSCWMVRGSSGTLELFHYCPCQGTRTLLFPSPLTSPKWGATSDLLAQWTGLVQWINWFPLWMCHCFEEQHADAWEITIQRSRSSFPGERKVHSTLRPLPSWTPMLKYPLPTATKGL